MSNVNLKFVVKNDKINSDGEARIYLRLIKDRKPAYVGTGIKMKIKYWDSKKGMVKTSHPNSNQIKNHLYNLEMEYQKKVLQAQAENLQIGLKQIKQAVVGSKEASFFDVADELIAKYRLRESIGTADKVKSIVNKVKRFCKNENLSLEEINVKFLTEYEKFVIEKLHNKRNTINKDLRFIRRVFSYAIQQDLIKEEINPFRKIKMQSEPTHREYLCSDEIALLESYEGSSLEMKCLKTCLFEYYSGGIRISDVLMLRKRGVENGRVNIDIRKTGKQLNHALNDKAQIILNEFIADKQDDDLVFNFMKQGKVLENNAEAIDEYISVSTALINKYLKTICEKVGIKKNVSTHTFRHSFAVNALEKGISMEQLQGVLKHSNIRETQIYAKIKAKAVDDALLLFSQTK